MPGTAEEGIKLVGFKEARRHVAGLVDKQGLHDIVSRNYKPKQETKDGKKTLSQYSRDALEEGRTRLDDIKYAWNSKEAAVVEAFTDGMGVFYAMRANMQDYLLSRPSRRGRQSLTEEEERFVTLYSLYGGCVEALGFLEQHVHPDDAREFHSVQKEYKEIWGSGNSLFHLGQNRDKVLEGLLKEYVNRFVYQLGVVVNGGLINKPIKKRDTTPEGNFSGMTYNFFLSLLDYLIAEKGKEEYEELVEEVTFPLGLHRQSINGFSYDPAGMMDDQTFQLNVDFKDIIGNQEATDFLKFTLQRLFLYNPAEKHNPYLDVGELARTALLYAGPGTGKTMSVKAAIKYAYELSELTGIPVNVVNITQDFKTEFFGQSSRRLKGQFIKGTDPRGVGLIIFEDLDALFKNRSDGDSSSGQAEENVVNTVLNLFEGVESEYYGNWLAISTSNRSHDIDKALAGRAGINKIYCPGATTLAELIQLNQNLTEKGRTNKYLEVSDKEWDEIAQVCKDREYNGRQIRNAAHTLLSGVGMYELDTGIYEMEPSARMKELLKVMRDRRVTGKDLLAAVVQAAEDEFREAEYDMSEKANDYGENVFVRMRGTEIGQKRHDEWKARTRDENLDGLPPEVREKLDVIQLKEENLELLERERQHIEDKKKLRDENLRLERELDKKKGKKK